MGVSKRVGGIVMPKKVIPLTDLQCKKANPKDTPQKLQDGGGLYLLIQPNGSKLWRMKIRFAGKENTLSFGPYPAVSLTVAREKRAEAQALKARGLDPSKTLQAAKTAQKIAYANTFELVAEEWIEKMRPTWKAGAKNKIEQRLRKDAFPWIGKCAIAELTTKEILSVLRRVEQRGAIETAHRLRQNIGQVMRYAVATGRAERDPTVDLRGALAPVQKTHLSAITDPKALGPFLRTIDGFSGTFTVRCALQLGALTFVRPGELRQAEWSEFDMENATWTIPAVKLKRGKFTGQDHLVPLSRQALAILEELRPVSGGGKYLFPGARDPNRPMSDGTVIAALRRMSIGKDEMCGHGFRAMARTLLDEVLNIRPDYIEHQLAHAVRDPNGRAYNRTSHLAERRDMMQKWADYLDSARSGATVLELAITKRA